MSDNKKPPEEDDAERDLVFHYSREHRLARASRTVRALNEEKPVRPSLTKTLFANKGNIYIFSSIILICAMLGITTFLSKREQSVKVGGNTLVMTVIREEEDLVLSIRKTAPRSGEFYIGAVDIDVYPVIPDTREGETQGDLPQVFSHRVYFNPADSESFYITLPFNSDDIYVIMSSDNEQKAVRIR